MPPVVFLSPALKAGLSLVAPWLAGAAMLGGMAGFQATTNARLKCRLAHLEKANHSAATDAPVTTVETDAQDRATETPRATEGAEASPKGSLLRRIMESNVTLRKPHTE